MAFRVSRAEREDKISTIDARFRESKAGFRIPATWLRRSAPEDAQRNRGFERRASSRKACGRRLRAGESFVSRREAHACPFGRLKVSRKLLVKTLIF